MADGGDDVIEAQAATIARQDAELVAHRDTIVAMRLQLERLRRIQFGRSSEKITAEITQLTLALEDLEASVDRKGESADGEPATPAGAYQGTWAPNRYYYQTMIPLKDASLMGSYEDQAPRREWRKGWRTTTATISDPEVSSGG